MSEVKKGMYKFTMVDSRKDYGLCGNCANANLREYGGLQEVICGADLGYGGNNVLPSPKRKVTACSRYYERGGNLLINKDIPPWMKLDALYVAVTKPKKAGERMQVKLLSFEEFNKLDIKDRNVGFK